ncbi:MAG: SIS domain-containing protein [Acidobacteria bacterium]|nr:SIS domain-containing protein [Acidobacteriota bacterium]
MRREIQKIFQQNLRLTEECATRFGPRIQEVVRETVERLRRGGHIFLMGNGGSAADAIHWAGELVGRFALERRGIPAVALGTDPAILTAVANDYDFATVFARQLECLAGEQDIIFALSTSGRSPNIIRALSLAEVQPCFRVGFSGDGGGDMACLVNVLFDVPSRSTPRIQEIHGLLGHIICGLIEQELFGKKTETAP